MRRFDMKWTVRNVVVGVDGSDQGRRAATIAAGLARANDARLHIVTVVRPPEGWWGVVGSPAPADALAASMAQAQRSILDRTVEQVDLKGLDPVVVEEIGDPAGALVAYCEENDADVLVVGRRGAGIVERVLIGSVADRLAHDAPCPLLIVP
jgi:nucleotide-binding universal stress UspA family protein